MSGQAPAPVPGPVPAFATVSGGFEVPTVERALVVFSGRGGLWWLRFLKPGFRHCFAVLHDGRNWLLYDPMSHVTQLHTLSCGSPARLCQGLLARGYLVVPVRPRTVALRPAPCAPFTCVEAVKRVLGLHARGVVTPWQLFRHLVKEEKSLDIGQKSR